VTGDSCGYNDGTIAMARHAQMSWAEGRGDRRAAGRKNYAIVKAGVAER